MLLSNLDASTSPYHQGPEDGLPWFAILNADYSPRPAWEAFRDMRAEPRGHRARSGHARRTPRASGGGRSQAAFLAARRCAWRHRRLRRDVARRRRADWASDSRWCRRARA